MCNPEILLSLNFLPGVPSVGCDWSRWFWKGMCIVTLRDCLQGYSLRKTDMWLDLQSHIWCHLQLLYTLLAVFEHHSFQIQCRWLGRHVILFFTIWQTTILRCLIEDLKPLEGTVEVSGCISYACQDPWLFSGTLRDNVLFGLPYDPTWYSTVIEACAMDKVFFLSVSTSISLPLFKLQQSPHLLWHNVIMHV